MTSSSSNGTARAARFFRCSLWLLIAFLAIALVSTFFSVERRAYSARGLSIVRLGDASFQYHTAQALRGARRAEWRFAGPAWPKLDRIGNFSIPISGGSIIMLPLWPAVVPLILLTWFAWLNAKRAAADRGVCYRCAYDLRGLPSTTTRCPECGAARFDSRGDRRASGAAL